MGFVCYLYANEWVFSSIHCEKCIEISRIIKLIGRDECLHILKDKTFKPIEHPVNKVEFTVDNKVVKPISYETVLKELNQTIEYKKK